MLVRIGKAGVVLGVSLAVAPHAGAQRCQAPRWSAAQDVRSERGRLIAMDPSSAIMVRDTLRVVGGMAFEWLTDTAPWPTAAPPDSAAIRRRIETTAGFSIDARNVAHVMARATADKPMQAPVLSAPADGRMSLLWSASEPGLVGRDSREISRLHAAEWRNGQFEDIRMLLPEMQRRFHLDGAIRSSGTPGVRVVGVQDAYPRFVGNDEILLAHEAASGWFVRRYRVSPSISGPSSAVRLPGSGDIVMISTRLSLSPRDAEGFRIVAWRIPSDSVRRDVRAYVAGAGVEIANAGDRLTDEPLLFTASRDTVIATWQTPRRSGPEASGRTGGAIFISLSPDGGRHWIETQIETGTGGISRPQVVRDGTGEVHLFYHRRPQGEVVDDVAGLQHHILRGLQWERQAPPTSDVIWSGVAFATIPQGLVALWSTADSEALGRRVLQQPRLRIARYTAGKCR